MHDHIWYSIDRQLIVMMLSQCFVHVTFRLPLPTYLIYDYATRHEWHFPINIYFLYIAVICFVILHCTFFYVNLMCSSFRIEFRRLVKNFFMKKLRQLRKHRRQRVRPPVIAPLPTIVEVELTLPRSTIPIVGLVHLGNTNLNFLLFICLEPKKR